MIIKFSLLFFTNFLVWNGFSQNFIVENIELPENSNSKIIHKVFTDNFGNLFISGEKGVYKWNGRIIEDVSKQKNFNDYSAFNIWIDNKKIIWINTFSENILNYKNSQVTNSKFHHHLNKIRINSSIQDFNGNYWFGDRFGRVMMINNKGLLKVNKEPSIEKIHRIHRIEPLRNGNIIAALTFGSFYLFNSKCEIIKKLNWQHDYNWGPANMFHLKNRKTIFCNFKGLYLYNENLDLEKFVAFDEAFKGYISDIKEDDEGNLWIGSKYGLFFMRKNSFSRSEIKNIIMGTFVNSISIGIEGLIWIATNSDGLKKVRNEFRSESANIFKKVDNNLYIPEKTIKTYRITAKYFDNQSKVLWWAGNHEFGRIKNKKQETYVNGKLVFLEPKVLEIDMVGNLWIGGNGLKIFNPTTKKLISIPELDNCKVQDCKFINPYVYVATRNKGVFIFKNGKILNNWNNENYLISNNCKKIIQVGTSIFFKFENRILKYICSNDRIIKASLINHNFKDLEISKITETQNSFICYYENGYIEVSKKIENNPFEIVMSSNGAIYDSEKFNKIKFHNGETNFNFLATTFNNQDIVFFRYRILKDGIESNWKITDKNLINLLSLESGIYKIIVEKSFDKFNWSKNKNINFEIIPPFWKNNWFKAFIVCAILLMISVFLIDRIKIEKEKRIGIEIKLISLQSQMNPHFIFNSLSSLQKFIITHSDEQSMHYLSKFAHLMRRCYEYANTNFITIEEEIDFLDSYLQMELARFNHKFKYEISSDVGKNYQIPPLVLQPLVENSLKHGITEAMNQAFIKISFTQVANLIQITISDNGTGINKNKINNSKSSINRLNDRFILFRKMYNNNEINISIASETNVGTKVTVSLPLNIPKS